MTTPDYHALYEKTLAYLRTKERILFLTTSNRWSKDPHHDTPKSTKLAHKLAEELGDKVTILDVPSLIIYPCEGNVSSKDGNFCGLKKAVLKDAEKNPTGQHRCWASVNNTDDELRKISKPLFESDAVVFFTSIRRGQTNSFYQKLIERLTRLENRHTTLKEDNILKNIDAGIIAIGHNWNGKSVVQTQQGVLSFFGFNIVPALCWDRSFTTPSDESAEGYKNAADSFNQQF